MSGCTTEKISLRKYEPGDLERLLESVLLVKIPSFLLLVKLTNYSQ
jgi:hypothetical protein